MKENTKQVRGESPTIQHLDEATWNAIPNELFIDEILPRKRNLPATPSIAIIGSGSSLDLANQKKLEELLLDIPLEMIDSIPKVPDNLFAVDNHNFSNIPLPNNYKDDSEKYITPLDISLKPSPYENTTGDMDVTITPGNLEVATNRLDDIRDVVSKSSVVVDDIVDAKEDLEDTKRKMANIKKLQRILAKNNKLPEVKSTKKLKFFSIDLNSKLIGEFNEVLPLGSDIILAQETNTVFNINKTTNKGLVLYKSEGNVSLKKDDTVLIETTFEGNSLDIFAFKVIETLGRKSRLVIMS